MGNTNYYKIYALVVLFIVNSEFTYLKALLSVPKVTSLVSISS